MRKQTEFLLVAIFILFGIFARTALIGEEKYGSDFFFHYTIVEQSLEKGRLEARNDLAYCYEGVIAGHPIGYYAIPYYIGKAIGLNWAFIVVPVLFGMLGLLMTYGFLRELFNKRIALLTVFFGAVSLAHASKSYMFSYRGDNIVYPLLIGSLWLLYKAFKENKGKKKMGYAISSGAISGLTSLFWNGYPFVFVVYFLAILGYVGYKYVVKEEIKQECRSAGIGIIAQAITFYMIFWIVEFHAKGLLFGRDYYPLGLGLMLISLYVVYLARKKKSQSPLIIYSIVLITGALLLQNKIKLLLAGFGSIRADYGVITTSLELYRTSFNQYYTGFFILGVTSIIGLYYFFRKFSKEKALFLGLLLPSIYLMYSAVRYVYIAAIPVIVLTAFFLDNKKKIGKKFDLFTFLTGAMIIAMTFWMFYTVETYLGSGPSAELKEAYAFVKEELPEDACIIALQQKGGMTEFLAKKHYYFNSLGFDEERSREVYTFLLTNAKPEFQVKEPYILLEYNDILHINVMNLFLKRTDVEAEPNIGLLYNRTYAAPQKGYVFHIQESDDHIKIIKVKDGVFTELRWVYKDGKLYDNKKSEGCMFIRGEGYVYFNDLLCNSNMVKMLTEQEIQGLEKVYAKDGVMIYRVSAS